jgi:N-methylhydantoinase B
MNATLVRSAYTPIIYEGRDCAVALLDERADVLGQSVGVPLFLGNLEACVKLTAERFGWDVFQPGDIFHMNDAYMTGTHLNDATIFGPVHWQSRLVGFVATRAHWLDVGAKDPGGPMDSHEIYQEGMRWGPTRIYERGQPRDDIIDVLRRNSRFGYSLVGDMNAQVAACRTGEVRLGAILDRFGYDTFIAARDEVFRQSEQLEREAVAAIQDGDYVAEGALDNDGLGEDPVPVRVRVEVEGDEIHIDLTGSSRQARGPVNCGLAQTISACRMAFKLLVAPNRPVDGGTFRTLRVTAPEGSIFAAQEPAACHWYFTPLGLLIDLVIEALAEALPDAVAGAHYGDSMVIYVAGRDPRRGDIPFLSVEPTPGGWGAYSSGDGQDGLINVVNGAFKDIPIEIYESKYPVTLREYGFRTDTGGPGRHRGGCGVRRAYYLEAPAAVSLWFERSRTPAWGLFGGHAGTGPDVVINPGRDTERHLLKANSKPLQTGDVVELRTGGGGGYGHPYERDQQKVRRDVEDGYVTRHAALRDYGVVVRDDFSIDEVETLARRAGSD